jgi:hypothetical protein
MGNFGFIITRHVNSAKTNKYWNHCVKMLNIHYPAKQIIIIDDNSVQPLVKETIKHINITVINSKFKGRGELLPYLYLLKHRWFPNAVIIHDSTFFHKRIPFDLIKKDIKVLPLWHHSYDKDNLPNLIRIASSLNNNYKLVKGLLNNEMQLNMNVIQERYILCFGVQTYIQLDFLQGLHNKYNLYNLVNVIRNRTDRCSLERVMGIMFCEEYPMLLKKNSLFGSVFHMKNPFSYTYEDYMNDIKHRNITHQIVKVWTGR